MRMTSSKQAREGEPKGRGGRDTDPRESSGELISFVAHVQMLRQCGGATRASWRVT